MNFLASFFSSGAATLIDSIGSAVDKLVTSDEERGKLKVLLGKEVNSFKDKQLDAVSEYDKQISSRHKYDMKSDSWLSKNVRPLTLVFLTVATVILAYLSIFILDVEDADLVKPWTNLLMVLLTTVYAFYFGSRGFEKVQGMKNK